jgi:hypothetical protein
MRKYKLLPLRARLVAGSLICGTVVAAAAFGARGPSLSPARTLTVPAEGGEVRVTVNDGPASFAISAPSRSAVEAAAGVTISTTIYPSFAAAEGTYLPSPELCRAKGLAFEEGAFSALELQLEKPTGALASGRGGFLEVLAAALLKAYEAEEATSSRLALADALAFTATALALSRADGKVPEGLGLPDDVVNKATQDKDRFLKENDWVAVPAGRYGWDKDLKPIYLASLWLGRPLERTDEAAFKTALALTWVVGSDAEARRQYEFLAGWSRAIMGWAPGTASPAGYRAMVGGRDALEILKELGTVRRLQVEAKERGEAFVFLPALGPAEVELIRRSGVPPGAEAYMEAARGDTEPARGDDPWERYFASAWAVLLNPEGTPEARKIAWDEGYVQRLAESYRTSFDQVRARAGPPPPGGTAEAAAIDVTPDLRLEPVPEYYLRMARAYARLEKIIQATFPAEVLAGVTGRREGGGAGAGSVAAEAAAVRELFYGLYLLSCADVGMTPAVGYGEVSDRAGAAARAYEWLQGWRSDPDMARDLREAWLLGPADPSNPGGPKIYRCFLGVRAVDVDVKYDRKPGFSTSRSANLRFKTAKYVVLVPVVVEVAVPATKPLTRAAFRTICNKHKTESAIVAALKEFGRVEEEAPPEEPVETPGSEVDRGMVVLIVVLAVFGLIIVIALFASRQRYY